MGYSILLGSFIAPNLKYKKKFGDGVGGASIIQGMIEYLLNIE